MCSSAARLLWSCATRLASTFSSSEEQEEESSSEEGTKAGRCALVFV